MEGGEEVVDVAVEGGEAEGGGAVCEEECVDKGAVLSLLVHVTVRAQWRAAYYIDDGSEAAEIALRR